MARRQPTRAGILNIWEYDSQVFEFGDGRLALRGRNGSGKSNALSLLFPFLLDGVMSAQRMDPMGGARSMRSLLLCRDDDNPGAGFRYPTRTGYAWMEFDGDAGPLTIGVGATASAQRPDANPWFFVTTRRVGIDFDLEVEGRPRSHRELAAELEPGEVFATAEEYRAALDAQLFGIGTARARRLVDLLLVLRRPHLAGKLDPESVSGALTAGLQSLDQSLIADVARSFDDLEATQQELSDLQTSLEVVERFLPVYVDHLVSHVRRRAERLIDANRQLRELRSRRVAADAEHAVAAEQVVMLDAAIDQLRHEIDAAEDEVETILASTAYRGIAVLDEVAKQARAAAAHADAARQRAELAQHHVDAAEQAVTDERRRLTLAEHALDEAVGAVRHHADAAGLGDETVDDPPVMRAHVGARRRAVAEVRNALRAAERAAIQAEISAAEAEQARRLSEAKSQQRDEAAHLVAAEQIALTTALAAWATASRDQLAASLARIEWERSLAAPPPELPSFDDLVDSAALASGAAAGLALAARQRVDALRRAVDDSVGEVARRRAASVSELDALRVERERVADEPNPGPPVAATRPDAGAAERAGAPLYACVDFAASVPDADRAGWESALHAAGLLDARVFPGGEVDAALDAALDAGLDAPLDAALLAGEGVARATLADLLVAVPCNGVEASTVDVLLRSLPIDGEVLSLGSDGAWRLGPLRGRFTKTSPEFIGHEARERRRSQRLAELDELIELAVDAIAEADALRIALAEVGRAVTDVLGQIPSTAAFDRALRAEQAAVAADDAARDALETAVAQSERAAAGAGLADGALRALAVKHRLGTVHDALDAVDASLRELERAASDWQHALVDVADRRGRVDVATTTLAGRSGDLADAQVISRNDAAAADREQRRSDMLRSQLGAEADAAERDLGAARERRERNRADEANTTTVRAAAMELVSHLAGEIGRLDDDVRANTGRVEVAATDFVSCCSPEIVEALRSAGISAVDEPPSEAGAIVRAARAAVDGTAPVVEGATDRMMKAYQQQLLDGLRAGHDPQLSGYDDVAVVRVLTVDGMVGVGRLVENLRAETIKLASLLSDRERQIFETHLLTRISEALRELLGVADEFEASINEQMADAPTESGMRVELRWEMNDDRRGVKEALSLLRYTPDMLGPEQREQLRAFFATAIQSARAADPGRSFADTLTEVLDYRNWHRFALYARFGDGQRRQMTRTFFRELSGGEAATVLHLPLFAAAAAHYSGCSTDAPRLVALDEAFVGIDERMRGRLMGLLVALDLDVLITSHEFWGAYPEVPELVVYDLMRRPPAIGVSAQQFTWRAGRATDGA